MDLLDTVDVGMDRPMEASMDAVDVATAAQRLGVPVATVYKRIQRGRLRVQRVDGHVYVVLDRPTPSMDPPSNGHGPRGHASMDSPEPDATARPPDAGADPSALALALAEIRGDRDRLAVEVARLHERLREAHVLLAQRPALPAPRDTEDQNTRDAVLPRPWWRRWLVWWRRRDA